MIPDFHLGLLCLCHVDGQCIAGRIVYVFSWPSVVVWTNEGLRYLPMRLVQTMRSP